MDRRKLLALSLVCLVASLAVCELAFAQGSPFGVARPGAASPPPVESGWVAWLLAKQAEFYRAMAALVRAAKADGSATWTLLGVSFLYGVFHAVGPGHGKAVISSYLIANDETWRRGVVLSFASALVQALVAIAIVGVAAALLGATAQAMGTTVRWIELMSYALITALGARLVWAKSRALLRAIAATAGAQADAFALAAASPGHGHREHHHGDGHHHHHHHPHDHGDAHRQAHEHHTHDDHCGHSHGPEPAMLAGGGGWQRGLTAVFAVGLRPCSGAILVLVFALAQGLFWTGVAATLLMGFGTALAVAAIATIAVGAKSLAQRLAAGRPGYGAVALRGVEVVAAVLVLAFGLLLLTGYLANERLMFG